MLGAGLCSFLSYSWSQKSWFLGIQLPGSASFNGDTILNGSSSDSGTGTVWLKEVDPRTDIKVVVNKRLTQWMGRTHKITKGGWIVQVKRKSSNPGIKLKSIQTKIQNMEHKLKMNLTQNWRTEDRTRDTDRTHHTEENRPGEKTQRTWQGKPRNTEYTRHIEGRIRK